MRNHATYLRIGLLTILSIAGFLVINQIYPRLHPLSQIRFQISWTEAVEKARRMIESDIPPSEIETKTEFIIDKKKFSPRSQISFSESLPVSNTGRYWEISLISRENKKLSALTLSSSGDEARRDLWRQWYQVRISPEGKVVLLDFETPRRALLQDSLTTVHPEFPGVREHPLEQLLPFLSTMGYQTVGIILTAEIAEKDSLGETFTFTLAPEFSLPAYEHVFKTTAAGSILRYEYRIIPGGSPAGQDPLNTLSIVIGALGVLVYLALAVAIFISIVQLSRRESISFKIALPYLFLIIGTTLFYRLMENWQEPLLFLALDTIPLALILGLAIFLLYPAADAMCRMQWPEKLAVSDLFLRGIFLSPQASSAIFRGIFLGVMALVAYVIPLHFYTYYWHGQLQLEENFTFSMNLLFPGLVLLLNSLNRSIFHEFFFRLFGISLLKKWLNKHHLVMLVGAVFALTFSAELQTSQPLVNILIYLVPNLLFIFFFIRYEIITSIVGFLIFHLLSRGIVFAHSGETAFSNVGYGIYLIFLLVVILAAITFLLRRKTMPPEAAFIPDYIRQREEKERLMRELDIARTVQLKFLPESTPEIPGYQIAAYCRPAWEVGGDYYDYFVIDHPRLGITIGDVSNKGISAAFYMTMIKGFMKALTLHHQQPEEILSEANALFYENVTRGHFISMIYGVLDSDKNEFCFARAGHHPVLLAKKRDHSCSWYTPPGIGIGLLPGHPFRPTLRPEKVQLDTGDVVVLFTDGYPEALNENHGEFGEENLSRIILENIESPPEEIIKALEAAVKKWEGQRVALDDRTIVVIRRLP